MFLAALNKIYYQNAKVLFVNLRTPVALITDKSEREKDILTKKNNYYKYYFDNIKDIFPLYQDYEESEIEQVYNFRKSNLRVINKNGISVLADTKSKYYNVINGSRLTVPSVSQPSVYIPTTIKNIYLLGNCIAVSIFAEDKDTVASNIQNYLYKDNINVLVKNIANWRHLDGIARQIISPLYNFNQDDLIVIISEISKAWIDNVEKLFDDFRFFHFIDISDRFQRPHNYGEIFIDTYHVTHKGLSFISDMIYPSIKNILLDEISSQNSELLAKVNDYFKYNNLKKLPYENIGAIVMNCNPFTKGHQYLINTALKSVDFLYIFIVEEDKSEFKFEDRISMVRENFKNIANIMIIPSGSIMISQETLPQYFEKDDVKDVTLDYTLDLNIFCRFIAPMLGITHRFAGSEPICPITSQYNAAMSKILPQYNIKFVEIARQCYDDKPISASIVRKYIKDNNFYVLSNLVPLATLKLLIKKGYIKPPTFMGTIYNSIKRCFK